MGIGPLLLRVIWSFRIGVCGLRGPQAGSLGVGGSDLRFAGVWSFSFDGFRALAVSGLGV